MAVCSGITRLTVALACQSITAAISISAVTAFRTVRSPVACITSCSTNITFRYIKDKVRTKWQTVIKVFQWCYPSCSCVQSNQEGRYTAHSLGRSVRCFHTHTSFGTPDQNVHLGMLHRGKKMFKTSRLIYHNQLHQTAWKHSKFPWQFWKFSHHVSLFPRVGGHFFFPLKIYPRWFSKLRKYLCKWSWRENSVFQHAPLFLVQKAFMYNFNDPLQLVHF